ncbi:MAG: hypothetical protein KatS3mg077_2939 [Candidatus Binatia bacterium]|nr:MAG: hypothetical protein KatS3mg077_2939 [Candidatus Binatia bacterium]
MKRYAWTLSIGVLWACAASAALAATVRVQGTSASPGDTPDVCVFLDNNEGNVAGLQADLFWDSSCLTADRSTGDQAACVVNPDTGRSLFQTRILSAGQMRVIMASLNDTSPMPASVSQLFCCQFRVSEKAAGRTCGVNLSNVILSDPGGQRLPVNGVPGSIAVRGGAQERGVRASGSGPGSVMVPAVVEGGAAPAAPAAGAGTTGGAAPAAPVAPAVGAAPAVAPAAPVAPVVPQMQAPAAAGAEGAAPAGATPEERAEATAASPAPTPAATKATPAATAPVRGTPPATAAQAVGTPTAEAKQSPAAPSREAKTPHKKSKERSRGSVHEHKD